jgi:cyclic pyranopterin phosphate synthase
MPKPRAPTITHLTSRGEARMVDVGAKPTSARRAVASARVNMSAQAIDLVASGEASKGDVLAVARVAGIQAAKRTPELIPLCHTIVLTKVEVAFDVQREARAIVVRATAQAVDRTGVEMEALVAASVAALTIYDMMKSVDRAMSIDGVRLEEKSGGKSGAFKRAKGAT